MDENLLEAIGLSAKEAALYGAVVKARQIAPAELAKAIGVKRTTAYSMARSLVEKGLLIEDATRRPRVFVPAGPEELKGAVEAEKKRSEEKQGLLRKLSDQVSLAQAETTYPVPKIKFIEESKMDQYFKQAFPIWNENMLDTKEYGFWGFQDATFVSHYVDQLHYWWKIRPEELYVKLLTNSGGGEHLIKGKYQKRMVKYWGEATDFISSTWIAGDYVIMINTRQHPFYVIEIQSHLLAHDQREVFKNLWELV